MVRSTQRSRQLIIALVSWGMAAWLIHCAGQTGRLPFLTGADGPGTRPVAQERQSRNAAPRMSPFSDDRVRIASILWCD